MKTLETNDWMVLNNIIYQINYLKDSQEMRENLLKQLLLIIDFDSANFFVTDSDDPRILKNMAGYNFSEKLGEDYVGLYEKLDYQKGLMFDGKSRVYRETDIMEDKKRQETEYYKQFYQPNGWHYSLHASLAFEKRSVGTLALFRRQGKEDFSYKDVFVLEMLQDHLALRIIKMAEEHQVTVMENVPLARALYASTELNRPIPPEFYNAVAEVLVYIYRMDSSLKQGGK